MKIIVGALLSLLSITSALAETVLITGTNRGIGLEFVKQYAERGATVIATARRPADAKELIALATRHPNVTIEALDVTDVIAIEALAKKYQGKPIDILINNAGTLGDVPKQTIGGLDQSEFLYVINANTYGALKMAEAFKPHLRRARRKKYLVCRADSGPLPW